MLFRETFSDGIIKAWVWDGLLLIPRDKDLQAYIFSYCNHVATTARCRTSESVGYPDDINNQFYACVPTYDIDPLGLCTSIAGIIISRCDVKDTKTGSVVKNLGKNRIRSKEFR